MQFKNINASSETTDSVSKSTETTKNISIEQTQWTLTEAYLF